MKIFPTQSQIKFSQIMTFSVYALKIIGLAPFHQQNVHPIENSRIISESDVVIFRSSKIGQAYNLLIFVQFLVVTITVFPILSSLSYPNRSSVLKYIDMVLGTFNCFTASFIVIFWALQQNGAACTMNKLLEVDRLLYGLEKRPLFNKQMFKVFLSHIIFNTCLWIVLIAAQVMLLPNDPVTVSFFTASVFIIHWFTVEYSMVVGLVFEEMKRVNKDLLKLAKSPIHSSVLSFSENNELSALQLIRSIRMKLAEVSQDTANFFSLPILFAIASSFCDLVYNLYYFISPLIKDSNAGISYPFISHVITFILSSIYPLALLSSNVNKTNKEAKLTSRIIHKLLAEVMKPEIKSELQQFSLLLLHEHLNFTAYGFFELDSTMLSSILGASASYVFILIQFQQADNSS